jgi:hypothetical protein
MASGVYTELQMRLLHLQGRRLRPQSRPGRRPTKAFEPSLFVWPTVMSRPTQERAIVDAGLKALAFDSGPPLVCDEPAAIYELASDEHGRLGISGATRSASSPAIATRPSTSTTGMSASAAAASSSSGRSPPAAQFIDPGHRADLGSPASGALLVRMTSATHETRRAIPRVGFKSDCGVIRCRGPSRSAGSGRGSYRFQSRQRSAPDCRATPRWPRQSGRHPSGWMGQRCSSRDRTARCCSAL